MTAEQLALLSAGVIFIAALLTGIWKWRAIMASPDAEAPYYVNIAHRAALLYAFAALLLAAFAARSAWPNAWNLAGVIGNVVFYIAAIAMYCLHGYLQDTDNQLKRPHKVGKSTMPEWQMTLFMALLAVGEVGGFLILFTGVLAAWWG